MDREARLAAVAQIEELLRRRPDDPNALNNLAVHARALGDTARAASLLRRAIAIDAANPAYHANLGNACAAAGDNDGAIEAYRAALACAPGRPAAAIQLASALHRTRRLEEGAAVAADALARDPGNGALHNVLGALLNSQRRYEAAAAHFRQAIALAPDRIDARINFAIAAMQLGQHQSALAELEAAIAAAGESAELLAHQGQALVSMGRLRDGLDRITRALALDPGNLDARLGRSRALFLLGEYESAWQAYDARWLRPDNPRPDVGIPLWQDEDPAGRAIFVVNEQGLGDTINFCRFLPMLAARARRVCLACQEPLVDLLRTSLPGVQVVPAGKRPRDLEFAIPLLDLPPRLGRFAPWWPGAAYLKASRPSPVALPSDGKRKVGLVWAGNPDHGNDRFRSLGLESLLFLGGDPRVRLVALQKGPAAAARTRLGAEALIMDAGERLYSFADTAALIARLDLVIAVDTAVAHLAGAMGKPAWILLPAAPDWRWGVAGERSGWYPSLRLFRQQTIGDWTGPLAALRDAWTTWLDGTGTHPDRPPP